MIDKKKLEIAVQALKDIVDPISRIKRNMGPGYTLDGVWAVRIFEDHNYLRDIAKTALKEIDGGD